MTKFKKGNSLGGRTKGATNKVNQPIRDNFLKLLENNLSTIQADLDLLEPKDRLKILLDLASFCVPKLKSIEVENVEPKEANHVELTEKEIQIITKELQEKY